MRYWGGCCLQPVSRKAWPQGPGGERFLLFKYTYLNTCFPFLPIFPPVILHELSASEVGPASENTGLLPIFSLWYLAKEARIYECLPGEPGSKCIRLRQAKRFGREEEWRAGMVHQPWKKKKRKKAYSLYLSCFFIWGSPRKQSRTTLGSQWKRENGDGLRVCKRIGR